MQRLHKFHALHSYRIIVLVSNFAFIPGILGLRSSSEIKLRTKCLKIAPLCSCSPLMGGFNAGYCIRVDLLHDETKKEWKKRRERTLIIRWGCMAEKTTIWWKTMHIVVIAFKRLWFGSKCSCLNSSAVIMTMITLFLGTLNEFVL